MIRNMCTQPSTVGSDTDTDEIVCKKATEITSLLHEVLKCLDEARRRQQYIEFHRLVKEGKFPLTIIAFLLFLDVVQWFGCATTTQMRNKNVVRQVWRTGYRLLKVAIHPQTDLSTIFNFM